MKNKKIIALILAVVMAMPMAACGQQNEKDTNNVVEQSSNAKTESSSVTTETESTESTGFTFPLAEQVVVEAVSLYPNEAASLLTSARWQEYEKQTNVHFDLTEILISESAEKVNLMLASGEYPEVFYRAAVDGEKYGAEEGILIPLDDLIREYAPNLTSLLDEYNLWDNVAAGDGHIYGLPAFGAPSTLKWQFRYNKAWLDNLGLAAPTNMDELYTCLKAIKEQDANGNGDPNDEIPMSFASNGFQLSALFAYLYQGGVSDVVTMLAYEGDGFKEASYYPISDQYKEFLANCAKWFEEGLIDELSFVQKHSDMITIAGTEDQYGFFVANQLGGEDRSANYHIVPMFDGVGGIALKSALVGRNTLAITDKCKNPELVIAWADGWYAEENTLLAWYGVEGTDWEYDEDGYIKALNESVNLQSGTFVPINMTLSTQQLDDNYKDPANAYLTEEAEKIAQYGVVSPTIKVDPEKSTQYNDLWAALYEYVGNYLALVTTGEKDLESTWDEYVAQIEAIGVSDYMQIVGESLPEGYSVAK